MSRNSGRRHPLNQSRLYSIQSRAKLAALFGHTRQTLDALLKVERPYTHPEIVVERNGKRKTRTVNEPRGQLRAVHNVVAKFLGRVEPPDYLFCPVKARSYVQNAAHHIGAREIRKLDIESYFPSTSSQQIYWFFYQTMKCSPDVAHVLAKLLTVNNHLATGSTVSPILSFYAFYQMWQNIAQIASDAGCKLSVYVDDVTLSGERVTDRVLWDVKRQIHSRKLKYHKENRYFEVGEITGAIVKQGRLLVPHRQHRKAFIVRKQVAEATEQSELLRLAAVLRGLKQQRKQIEGHV